jgi:ACT domain-containing protein
MQTTSEERTISFARIDALRKHMLLSKTQMVRLLGVSRVTYYNWRDMGHLPTRGSGYTKKVLREMLRVMVEHEWPTPTVVAMTPDERLEELQRLIKVV